MISQRLIAGQFTRLNRKSEAAVPSRGLAKAKWFHPQSPFPPGYNLFASTASTGAAVSEAKKSSVRSASSQIEGHQTR